MAAEVGEWFGTVKVGHGALRRSRPRRLRALPTTLGYRVFADLKLHDIPNTVGARGATCSAATASTS